MEEYLNKIISDNDILNSNMKCVKVNAGFTNTVYIFDDKYIIKICSDRGNKNRFIQEINFYLSNNDNKYIPRLYRYYIGNGEDYSYEIIEKVEGVTLYNVWHTLSLEEREDVLKLVVDMMKSIHKIKGEVYNFALYIKNKLNNEMNEVSNLFDGVVLDRFNNIIKNIDRYFMDNDFRLIHGDLHFDNILIDSSNNIKVIDFERALIAPIDYELDIFLRMCYNPIKYASLEEEKYVNINDYKDIPKYLKEYYPEIFDFEYFNIRHLIYDLEANLRILPRFKDDIELRDKVIEVINELNELISEV